uniref:Uncharacterized protein n=1 Tax=Peronospora matthiolae TaxID=2874970 RepID=A0AAV1TDK4_9STRA
MRSAAAVLGLALGVSSQSTAGRSSEAAACDAQGAQPVHVVGVGGTFCVQVRPCEGVVFGEGFSCPLMGQRDVLGETELPTDSCCAVVDSDSGALGCVLVREGEAGDAVCLWSRVEEGARVSQRRRRRWRFPADATRTDDVTGTRGEAFEATDAAPPAVSLSMATLPEAAEDRALEPETGDQVASAVGLTVAPVVTSTISTVTTATAPVVTTTPATVAATTYTPAGPNSGEVTVATVGTTASPGTILAATSDPVASAPVAASAIPMLTIPAPSVVTSTTPAINPAAIATVPEPKSFSGVSPVPVTSLPELSSMSDSIDEIVQPELSSMSDSADVMILPDLSSMSGSTDVVILPELSSMSGSTDADLVLTPTSSPSPATLPPFTAMLSSQSGSGLAGVPTVISTVNATSMQPSTTPPSPTPVLERNSTTPTPPPPTLIVSGSSSGSDDSDDSGSFPEGSIASTPRPGFAIMSMEFSSSGSGDYPEIESTSVPAETTGSVDGSRAAAVSANVNDSSVSPPWLVDEGLESDASSASIDVSDSWSPTSKSRGADSLDNGDSSAESLSGEVGRPGSSSSGSGFLPPLSTTPPLLFPSSGSLKTAHLPPSESASPNGVLVLAPIMDHGGDSVNPPISGGSQFPVNGEEIRGSDESSAADTQTIMFIIIGCIVAAALVFGAVWLRPKRASSVDISNLREPPEPMDTSYLYVESEPAGPYDASSTPRVINGYDRMDVRGSNEYFSA